MNTKECRNSSRNSVLLDPKPRSASCRHVGSPTDRRGLIRENCPPVGSAVPGPCEPMLTLRHRRRTEITFTENAGVGTCAQLPDARDHISPWASRVWEIVSGQGPQRLPFLKNDSTQLHYPDRDEQISGTATFRGVVAGPNFVRDEPPMMRLWRMGIPPSRLLFRRGWSSVRRRGREAETAENFGTGGWGRALGRRMGRWPYVPLPIPCKYHPKFVEYIRALPPWHETKFWEHTPNWSIGNSG